MWLPVRWDRKWLHVCMYTNTEHPKSSPYLPWNAEEEEVEVKEVEDEEEVEESVNLSLKGFNDCWIHEDGMWLP